MVVREVKRFDEPYSASIASFIACARSQGCELQKLALELGLSEDNEFEGLRNIYAVDDLSPAIVRDNNKCILCRRCVSACQNQQDCPCARQDFFQSFFHLNFSLSFYFS